MAISNASAQWTGGLKDGKGVMKPAHAPEAAFTLASRFEGAPSSSPEELIGAALAGCFSMALTVGLETAGLKPQSVKHVGHPSGSIATAAASRITGIDLHDRGRPCPGSTRRASSRSPRRRRRAARSPRRSRGRRSP